MSVIKIIKHVADLTDNSDAVVTTNPVTVDSGIYRILNADTHSAHFSIGGNPNASTDVKAAHILPGTEVLVKNGTPKRAVITAATAANPCVLTVGNGGTPAHSFSVGDYVTLTDSSVTGYNTAITHVAVTAVTNTTITVNANTSALAAFTGTATLKNSIKISCQGDTSNGLTIYIDEVQIVGG